MSRGSVLPSLFLESLSSDVALMKPLHDRRRLIHDAFKCFFLAQTSAKFYKTRA